MRNLAILLEDKGSVAEARGVSVESTCVAWGGSAWRGCQGGKLVEVEEDKKWFNSDAFLKGDLTSLGKSVVKIRKMMFYSVFFLYMLSIETRFCDILVGYTQPVLRYCKFQVMRLQGHQPGSRVATHCHAPRLGRAALSPRAAWPGGVCQGHTGTVDGWPWTAPGHETGSPSWTLVRLVVAARGFWSPQSNVRQKVLVAFS